MISLVRNYDVRDSMHKEKNIPNACKNKILMDIVWEATQRLRIYSLRSYFYFLGKGY